MLIPNNFTFKNPEYKTLIVKASFALKVFDLDDFLKNINQLKTLYKEKSTDYIVYKLNPTKRKVPVVKPIKNNHSDYIKTLYFFLMALRENILGSNSFDYAEKLSKSKTYTIYNCFIELINCNNNAKKWLAMNPVYIDDIIGLYKFFEDVLTEKTTFKAYYPNFAEEMLMLKLEGAVKFFNPEDESTWKLLKTKGINLSNLLGKLYPQNIKLLLKIVDYGIENEIDNEFFYYCKAFLMIDLEKPEEASKLIYTLQGYNMFRSVMLSIRLDDKFYNNKDFDINFNVLIILLEINNKYLSLLIPDFINMVAEHLLNNKQFDDLKKFLKLIVSEHPELVAQIQSSIPIEKQTPFVSI